MALAGDKVDGTALIAKYERYDGHLCLRCSKKPNPVTC